MAAKTHVPQQGAFQSDPTEQIFSRGVLDRDMSGLSYMFLNAAQQRRDASTEEYMRGVSEANRIAAALSQQDAMMDMLKESLKQAPEYAKAGLPVADVPMLSRLFQSGGTGQAAEASALVNELKRAQIAADLAKAAASGREGQTEFRYEIDDTPTGPGHGTWKAKGRDPSAIEAEMHRRVMAAKEARKQGGALAPIPVKVWGANGNTKTNEYNAEQARARRAERDRQ